MKPFLARLRRRQAARTLTPPVWLVDAMARRLERCAAFVPLGLYMPLYERLVRASANGKDPEETSPRGSGTKSGP